MRPATPSPRHSPSELLELYQELKDFNDKGIKIRS